MPNPDPIDIIPTAIVNREETGLTEEALKDWARLVFRKPPPRPGLSKAEDGAIACTMTTGQKLYWRQLKDLPRGTVFARTEQYPNGAVFMCDSWVVSHAGPVKRGKVRGMAVRSMDPYGEAKLIPYDSEEYHSLVVCLGSCLFNEDIEP